MLYITRVTINTYHITSIDFMGYEINKDNASCHHLIVPRCNGGSKASCNVVALNQYSSHPLLHTIELHDYDKFFYITKRMMEEVKLGRIDAEEIEKIFGCIETFENEHSGDVNFNGEPIIKEEYTKRLSLNAIKSRL